MSSSAVPQATLPTFAERAITGADLRTLIERGGLLRGKYVIPSAVLLEDLASATNVLRARVHRVLQARLEPKLRMSDERKRRASAALQTLADVLPGIRDDILAAPDVELPPHIAPPGLSSMMRWEHLSQLDALARMVDEAWEFSWLTPFEEKFVSFTDKVALQPVPGAYAVPAPSPVRQIDRWHHFVVFLAEKFRDAVQAANPSLPRLANSNDGPVSRFLVAIVPHITAETPTPDAVRKWLRDHPTPETAGYGRELQKQELGGAQPDGRQSGRQLRKRRRRPLRTNPDCG